MFCCSSTIIRFAYVGARSARPRIDALKVYVFLRIKNEGKNPPFLFPDFFRSCKNGENPRKSRNIPYLRMKKEWKNGYPQNFTRKMAFEWEFFASIHPLSLQKFCIDRPPINAKKPPPKQRLSTQNIYFSRTGTLPLLDTFKPNTSPRSLVLM